jgi:hypothetical protein
MWYNDEIFTEILLKDGFISMLYMSSGSNWIRNSGL